MLYHDTSQPPNGKLKHRPEALSQNKTKAQLNAVEWKSLTLDKRLKKDHGSCSAAIKVLYFLESETGVMRQLFFPSRLATRGQRVPLQIASSPLRSKTGTWLKDTPCESCSKKYPGTWTLICRRDTPICTF